MYRYEITLKVTIEQAGLEYIVYPVIMRCTNTSDRRVVEQAAKHRYIRENWGSIKDVEIARTSVRVEGVA